MEWQSFAIQLIWIVVFFQLLVKIYVLHFPLVLTYMTTSRKGLRESLRFLNFLGFLGFDKTKSVQISLDAIPDITI